MDIPMPSRVPVSVIAPSVLRTGDFQMFFMVVGTVRAMEGEGCSWPWSELAGGVESLLYDRFRLVAL